jgi:hypothetical protein
MNMHVEKNRIAMVRAIAGMSTTKSQEIAKWCHARKLEILAASIAGEYYKVHVVDAFGYKDTVWYSAE